MAEKEGEKSEEAKGNPIYVKVSDETRAKIDKFKEEGKTISSIIAEAIDIYDTYSSLAPDIKSVLNKYHQDFGTDLAIIDEALKLFDKQKDPEKADDIDLWCRARDELKMMLIGKTTFIQLLAAAEAPEESLDRPIKKNIALDVIVWYTGKPAKSLTLEEIIYAIQKMWNVANYFYFIDVKETDDEYYIIFKHHQNRRYSNYWMRYFQELFSSSDLQFKVLVEGEILDETLSLTIKKAYKK
ncbi:MAG: hypothetical protein ACFFFB_13550 [Candidatus Heimdallarchaeota archaeon]